MVGQIKWSSPDEVTAEVPAGLFWSSSRAQFSDIYLQYSTRSRCLRLGCRRQVLSGLLLEGFTAFSFKGFSLQELESGCRNLNPSL